MTIPQAPAGAVDSASSGARTAPLRVVKAGEWSHEQCEAARRHFLQAIFAALTPLAIDPGHPFPRVRSGSLNLAALIRRHEGGRGRRAERHLVAVVQLPSDLPRLVPVPCDGGPAAALLEDVVADCAALLFPGQEVVEIRAFRVVRERGSGRMERRDERRATRRATVRLELAAAASERLAAAIATGLRLELGDVHRVLGPLAASDLSPEDGDGRGAPSGGEGPALRAG